MTFYDRKCNVGTLRYNHNNTRILIVQKYKLYNNNIMYRYKTTNYKRIRLNRIYILHNIIMYFVSN